MSVQIFQLIRPWSRCLLDSVHSVNFCWLRFTKLTALHKQHFVMGTTFLFHICLKQISDLFLSCCWYILCVTAKRCHLNPILLFSVKLLHFMNINCIYYFFDFRIVNIQSFKTIFWKTLFSGRKTLFWSVRLNYFTEAVNQL